MKSLLFSFLMTLLLLFSGSAQLQFLEQRIDSTFTGVSAIDLKDLNRDGLTDIIAASHGTQTAAFKGVKCWIRTEGNPVSYSPQVVSASYRPITCFAADLNGDSLIDIIAGSWVSHDIVAWMNGGGDPIVWTQRTIATGFTNAHEVYAADIDQDGDNDILGAASGTHEIALWINEGGDPVVWTKHTVSSTFGQAKSVVAVDIDGDGDRDLAGAAFSTNEISWWRNDGGDPIVWTPFVIDNAFSGAHRVVPCDLDGDTTVDLLATAYTAGDIAWWRNGGGNPVVWTKQTIEADLPGVFAASPGDLDNDGDIDVVGSTQPGNQIAYWLNDGGDPIIWTKHIIADPYAKPWPVNPVDVDFDGDMDIIAGGDPGLGWWKNVSAFQAVLSPPVQTIFAGDSALFSIVLTQATGAHFPVTLGASVVPLSGKGSYTFDFLNNPLTPTDSCDVVLHVSRDFSPGSYSINIEGITAEDTTGFSALAMFTVLARETTLTIEYTNEGWDILSVPLVTRFAIPSAGYTYEAGYVRCDTVTNGKGYWEKLSGTVSRGYTGIALEWDTVAVKARWNLIGSISLPVPVSKIESIPAGIILGDFFAFDPVDGYEIADTLHPGRGYWVKIGEKGALVLAAPSGGGLQPQSQTIIDPVRILKPTPDIRR